MKRMGAEVNDPLMTFRQYSQRQYIVGTFQSVSFMWVIDVSEGHVPVRRHDTTFPVHKNLFLIVIVVSPAPLLNRS